MLFIIEKHVGIVKAYFNIYTRGPFGPPASPVLFYNSEDNVKFPKMGESPPPPPPHRRNNAELAV